MRTSKEIKNQIFELVQEYVLAENEEKERQQTIPAALCVNGVEERLNLVDAALDFLLTGNRYCSEFEKALAEYLSVAQVAAVNSGSSANLVAFTSLTSPLLGDRAIQRGDEVICVALAFPTSVSPIIQYGAVPVFVDVCLGTYNIDITKLEDALSSKTKCVFLAHTLGNPFNLKAVKEFCDAHGLWLIEDNCDSLGAEYDMGDGFQRTGTIGDFGTSSFYPAHHITTGEGGGVYTNDKQLARIMVSMRDWGRHCICPPGKDNTCMHRFDGQYGLLPKGYDHKFVYSHFGYNLKMADMQAAIGCAQLKKLSGFIEHRQDNWTFLKDGLMDLEDRIILPEQEEHAKPSWFGFPITVRQGIDRNKVVHYLEEQKIQTRMLFAGNLIYHPCFDELRKRGNGYKVIGDLTNTNRCLTDSFWVGVHPGLDAAMRTYLLEMIREAIRQF